MRNLTAKRSNPVQVLTAGRLPSERVSEDPPFIHVGLDFAGPLITGTGNCDNNEST